MNYNPGINYRGDQWIMQGGQQMAGAMTQLLQYLMNRGAQQKQLAAQAETLIGPDSAPAMGADTAYDPSRDLPAGGGAMPTGPAAAPSQAAPGGFNPVTPSAGGDEGPSPAAQRGAQADALRKLIQTYAPGQKDLHQAVKGMGVDQLEGMLKGYAMKQAASEHAARMEDYNAQAALRRQQALDDQTVGKLVQAYGSYDPGSEEPPGAGERLRYAFSQVPEAGGRALPKAIEALTRYEQLTNPKAGEDLTARYTEDPVTGARSITYGKQLQSTGYNPAKAAPTFLPQHDGDGNLIGWSETDIRGKSQFHTFKGNATFKPAMDPEGNGIPGYYVDAQGKSIDARSLAQKMSGAAPAAKGATTPATYKTADEVKAAVKAGNLTKADAVKILRKQFGMQ